MGITTEQAFPSKWLGKHDVKPAIVATIRAVTVEQLGQDTKPVLYFAEPHIKPMSLNVGNWRVLVNGYGDDSDAWIGKRIQIYADPFVQFQGETVGGLKLCLPGQPLPPFAQAPRDLTPPPAPSSDPFGGELLSWPDAIALVATVGVSKDQLTDALKARGLTGYNSARDTAAIREIVAAQSGEMPTGSDIPF